jgi:hypothetical protein
MAGDKLLWPSARSGANVFPAGTRQRAPRRGCGVMYARGSSSRGKVLAMIYFKATPSKAKKAAKNAARIAAWQARWREARAKNIEKLAKKARMTKSQRNSARRRAAAEARRREVRAKNIANRPGKPPPDIDAPGTRFDVNYYSSGPSYIRDIGVIEKRKK